MPVPTERSLIHTLRRNAKKLSLWTLRTYGKYHMGLIRDRTRERKESTPEFRFNVLTVLTARHIIHGVNDVRVRKWPTRALKMLARSDFDAARSYIIRRNWAGPYDAFCQARLSGKKVSIFIDGPIAYEKRQARIRCQMHKDLKPTAEISDARTE